MEQVSSTPYASPPGVFARPDLPGGLGYWTGSEWDPRPVASIWTRLWALAIDLVITSILTLPLLIGLPLVVSSDASTDTASLPALLLVQVLYFTVSYVSFGRSLGMRAAGLTVVSIDAAGGRLSLGSGLLRSLVLCISFVIPLLALAWLIWTASSSARRGPQDLAAGSAVLRGAAQVPATHSAETDGEVTHAPTQPRRRATAVVITAFSILLLVLAAVYLDSRVKAAEMETLLGATTASESIVLNFKDSYDALQSEYESRTTACIDASCWDSIFEEWRDAQQGEAQRHFVRLQEAALDVEAVSTLPWHGDVATSRDAYLEHVDAWLERLNYESTYEIDEYSESRSASIGNEISRTWVVAERRYRDVTILLAPDEIERRVEIIFQD